METTVSFPIEITYSGLPPSPSLNREIVAYARHLDPLAPPGSACRVTVRRNEEGHDDTECCLVTVRTKTPGAEFQSGQGTVAGKQGLYEALHAAIDLMERQLATAAQASRPN